MLKMKFMENFLETANSFDYVCIAIVVTSGIFSFVVVVGAFFIDILDLLNNNKIPGSP
jgi:hypothetical protein